MGKTRDILDLKVLYVEDEQAIRESLTRFLRRRVKHLHLAENGEIGLALYHEVQPDIIVTDIRMPEMDGLEMCAHIRETNRNIPIIITTGHNDEEYFLRSIDIGVDKYLKKPVNAKEFVETVAHVARSVLQQKEIDQQNAFIRKLIDASPLFMMITNGEEITYLNASFLRYLDASSLEDFHKKSKDLDPFLLRRENTFYQNMVFSEIIQHMSDNPAERHILYMRPCQCTSMGEQIYEVKLDHIPGHDEYLLTFVDITQLEQEKQHYHDMAHEDFLTKLANRKKFDTELDREIERANRYKSKLSVIMFDIDYFKRVNDTFGHPKGDTVLIKIAHTVAAAIRKPDTLARYGGEEFTLLMPETTAEKAAEIADRLREDIAELDFGEIGKVTCSFGVTSHVSGEDQYAFIARADEALYQAKNNGRNRVEIIQGK